MNNLIERLTKAGYTADDAKRLYDFYYVKNDLSALEDFVIIQECANNTQ